MIIKDINNCIGGWFIGNFNKATFKTSDFEVAYKTYKKGFHWEKHYHKEAVEINYLIKGKLKTRGVTIEAGNIFIIEQNEVSEPEFLEDCELIVVKTPSMHGDKYIVDD